jgi:hypothetical protein
VPLGKVIHVSLDNYRSQKAPQRPEVAHPTPASDLLPHADLRLFANAVETLFSALTRRRIRRGSFQSIVDLRAAIHRYIAEHNAAPKPFTWTKPPAKFSPN